tara:strand:+ start:3315 stop:3563 length:249 start_codon:yes stop_codon:yes gene_type:complete
VPNITVPVTLLDGDGEPTIELRLWVQNITADGLATGAGSPEGVLEARTGREYMDTAGVAGAIKYIKQVNSVGGDKTLGWVLI